MRNYVLIIASFFAGPTFAEMPAAVSNGTDWTGVYAGVSAGSVNSVAELVFVPGNISHNGPVYGGFVGYNYDLGNIVVGAEYEYTSGVADATAIYTVGATSILKARLGYDFGSILLYGVGGYSAVTFDLFSGAFERSGFSYGVGADYRLTENWSIGAEYMSFTDPEFSGVGMPQLLNANTFNARVSYAF